MQVTTRIRPRALGWVGIVIALVLPAALGASYVGAINATTLDDRQLLWQVTIALFLLVPVGPLFIIFGVDAVTRPDPEALARIDKIIAELEYANHQAAELDRGLTPVREVADHMARRLEEARNPPSPPPDPTPWRR